MDVKTTHNTTVSTTENTQPAPTKAPHVVIIGGGFGGLQAAKKLGQQPVEVTVIDHNNFHLFQPMLYQVSTGVSLPPILRHLSVLFCTHRQTQAC